MADLGNLWFSLGLDDSKFEKQWKQAFAKYKDSAKIKVDFEISDKSIKELNKFANSGFSTKQAREYANLAQSVIKVATAQEKYNRELAKTKALERESNAKVTMSNYEINSRVYRQDREANARIMRQNAESLARQEASLARKNKLEEQSEKTNKRIGKHYRDQSLWVQNLITLSADYFSLYAVRDFVTNLAAISGEFEKQKITLQAMVGELEGLDIYGKIKNLSVESPFQFKELSSYAKQLASFSVPYEEIYETTKKLADVSAGVGVDMSRIILAYGQIKSAGVLKGCLGKDTLIKTINGVKAVQDIVVGDILLNDRNEQVNVLELIRGKEQMYLVKQSIGDDYRVNENHILTLWDDSDCVVVDIYIKDYLKEPERYLGYKFIAPKEWEAYPISIEKDIEDDYYGFVLDGNKRFQLADGTVTHNTELRQLTEAGVPILEKLVDKFKELRGESITVGDVFDYISQKMVSFEMVKDVFDELTSEGGKFYKMQEIQSETLAGKISNLKDAYEIMLSTIGKRTEDELKGGVEILYSLMRNWEMLGRIIVSVFASFSAYQGVKIYDYLSEKVIKLTSDFSKLYNEALKTKNALSSVFTAFKGAAGWGAVLAIAVGIGTAIWQWYRAANMYRKEMDSIVEGQATKLEQEKRAFEELTKAIDGATKGSQNRRDAINEFNNRYGAYLQNMLTEKSTAQELATAYNNVAEAMRNKTKQEALSKAQAQVESKYGSAIETRLSDLRKQLQERGLSGEEAKDVLILLRDYYSKGGKQLDEINKIIKDRIGDDLYKKAGLGTPDGLRDSLKVYLQKEVEEYETAMKEAIEQIDTRFDSSTYSTKAEAEMVNRINKLYEERIANLKELELSPEEYQKKLREYEELKLQELAKGYGQLQLPEIADSYIKQWEKLRVSVEGWRKEILQLAKDKNVATVFAPQQEEDWFAYVERIQSEYKKVKDKLDNIGTDPAKQKEILKGQKTFMEAMANIYKISLDPKGQAKTEAAKEKERINALKEEYQWALKVYDAYKKLREQGLSDQQAKDSVIASFEDLPESILSVFQDEHIISDWFVEELRSLAAVAAKNGSSIGEQLSNAILLKLGGIKSSEVLESIKIVDELQKELAKWGMEDFTLKGEGVTLDISKILRDQNTANNKAADERIKLLDQIYKAEQGNEEQIAALKRQYGEEWATEARKRINELYELEISNNSKIAEDKIAEMGKAYVKEAIGKEFSADFFSNLGEKSLTQLKETSAQLQLLMNTPSFMMDETFLDVFAADQELLDKFIKQWQEYIALSKSDVDIEHFNKVKQAVVKSGKAVSGIIDSLKQFTDTDSGWANLLDGLGLAVGTATDIAGAFEMTTEKNKEGEVISKKLSFNWGSIASAAGALISNIISSIVASREYSRQMEIAEEKFATSVAQSRRELEISGEKFETIFGENIIAALEADSNAISDLVRDMRRASAEISKSKITTKKGFLGMGKQTITLKDLAPQLFKADGSVNGEYLDEFLDAYGDKLDDSQKALLETLKTNYEQYKDAMEDINSYLSDIFSDTASSIADRMMEAFVQTGNAATELGDLVNSIAKGMAKDLIQSLLVDQYLEPAINRVKSLYNPSNVAYEEDAVVRTQKAILAVQDAMQAAQAAVPEVNRILEAIQNMGIDLSGDTEKATDVLSGLTEEQQNLLMGYINGIRADVSYNKGLLSNIVTSVGTINNNIATAIIVWKQIEANTHRSADGVDRIIGFFESVMGPYDGGGGQAFQVNIA